MRIGYAVSTARKAQRLTQGDVCAIAKIDSSSLSLIERGKRTPKIATIDSIAKALNVPTLLLYTLALETNERRLIPSYLLTSLDNWVNETLAQLAWEEED